jgi:hypothetical protein
MLKSVGPLTNAHPKLKMYGKIVVRLVIVIASQLFN